VIAGATTIYLLFRHRHEPLVTLYVTLKSRIQEYLKAFNEAALGEMDDRIKSIPTSVYSDGLDEEAAQSTSNEVIVACRKAYAQKKRQIRSICKVDQEKYKRRGEWHKSQVCDVIYSNKQRRQFCSRCYN
jgi:hypothetical protein